MVKRAKKISQKWILETCEMFREFLDETDFPDPQRSVNDKVIRRSL